MIFGDALYLKTPETICAMEGITEEKIIRSIFIYFSYGYLDLVENAILIAIKKGLLRERAFKILKTNLLDNNTHYISPDFPGRQKVKNIFWRLFSFFSSGSWNDGSDETLGNN